MSRALGVGTLLTAVLIGLTGCPEDGGVDTSPPAQSVSVNDLVFNGIEFLFELTNPNNEEVRIGIALSPNLPKGTTIEFDGRTIPLTADARIPLTASGDTAAKKQIRIIALVNRNEYILAATTFDTSGNAHSEKAFGSANTTPPDPPENLRFTVGDGEITLNWDAVSAANSYYRVYNDGRRLVIDLADTTYTHKGLNNGTTYRYTVRVLGSNGIESGNSNEVTATPTDPPDPPGNLRFTSGDEKVTLTWNAVNRATSYDIYRDGVNTATVIAPIVTHTDSGLTSGTTHTYTVRAIDTNGLESDHSNKVSPTLGSIDSDGDLLIDIFSLEEFNNIRYNLAGTSYRTSASDPGEQCGITACAGYELMNDLDFDDANSYADGINNNWRPDTGNPETATNAGWHPIGVNVPDKQFSTIFEGNGNTVSSIYVRRSGSVGLFSAITSGAVIRNIGIVNGADLWRGGERCCRRAVGGQSGGTIVASYASGNVDGGVGSDAVGGFMGERSGGSTITASYASGNVNGGVGRDAVGGFVGAQYGGTVVASYADGEVNGGADTGDTVGQFAGIQRRISSHRVDIILSYGFNVLIGGETEGDYSSGVPLGVNEANHLTAGNAGGQWDDAALHTMGAWDFGTTSEPPALQYADYDGGGTVYACANASNPPAGAILIAGANCGSGAPLPNQP